MVARDKSFVRKIAFVVFFLVIICTCPLQAAGSLLWSVRDTGGHQIFLMGSLHLATAEMYPLKQPIIDAFARSTRLVVELDVSSLEETEMSGFMMSQGFYRAGDSLEQSIKPTTLELLQGNRIFRSITGASKMKPWFISIIIQALGFKELGFDDKLGLDIHFINKAKERGIQIHELETFQEQMSLFSDMSPEESENFLKATILDLDQLPADVEQMVSAWRDGNVEAFNDIFFQTYKMYPELAGLLDRIIYDRNELMFERLLPFFRMKGELSFVVVGSGHLVGSRGLPEMFAAKGYVVEQY